MEAVPVYQYDPNIVIEAKSISGSSFYYPDPTCDEFINSVDEYRNLEMLIQLNKDSSNNFSEIFFELKDVTNQENVKKKILSQDYIRRLEILTNSFNESFIRKRSIVRLSENVVCSKFKELASIFTELPFDDGIVEITNSQSIKFTFLFKNDKLLLISKSIEEDLDVDNNEIVFSLFINRELTMSNVTDATQFVEGFQKFL